MIRWGALIVLLFAGAAQAQEISCKQVFMNPSEKAICDSPELLAIDAQMAQAYRDAKPHLDGIRKDQRAFKRERKACKGDMSCLLAVYEAQIAELRSAVPPSEPVMSEADEALVPPPAEESAMPGVVSEVARMEPEEAPAPAAGATLEPLPESSAPTGNASDGSTSWWVSAVVVVGALLAVGAFISWLWEMVRRCPSCGKWWADEIDRAEQVGTDYKTVKRVDKHRDRKGMVMKTVERQEQVAYKVVNAAVQLQCGRCNHQWIQHQTRRL